MQKITALILGFAIMAMGCGGEEKSDNAAPGTGSEHMGNDADDNEVVWQLASGAPVEREPVYKTVQHLTGLAMDNTSFYWSQERATGAKYDIVSAPKTPGPIKVLSEDVGNVEQIALDDDTVYFVTPFYLASVPKLKGATKKFEGGGGNNLVVVKDKIYKSIDSVACISPGNITSSEKDGTTQSVVRDHLSCVRSLTEHDGYLYFISEEVTKDSNTALEGWIGRISTSNGDMQVKEIVRDARIRSDWLAVTDTHIYFQTRERNTSDQGTGKGLARVSIDGKGWTPLLPPSTELSSSCVLQGNKIYFASETESSIGSVELDGRNPTLITDGGSDTTRLALDAENIYIMPSTASDPTIYKIAIPK